MLALNVGVFSLITIPMRISFPGLVSFSIFSSRIVVILFIYKFLLRSFWMNSSEGFPSDLRFYSHHLWLKFLNLFMSGKQQFVSPVNIRKISFIFVICIACYLIKVWFCGSIFPPYLSSLCPYRLSISGLWPKSSRCAQPTRCDTKSSSQKSIHIDSGYRIYAAQMN